MMNEGRYFGKLKDAVTSETGRGSLQVVLSFSISHVAENGDWCEINTVDRRVFLSLSDRAWSYTEKKLKALGFEGDFGTMEFGSEVHDQGIALNCAHDEYEGETKEKWDIADWGGGAGAERAPEDKLRRLNAKWRNDNQQPAQPAGAPSPPPTSRSSTPF